MIYFARRTDGTGPIKIGYSAWPIARIHEIEIALKISLELLAEVPGGFREESDVHRKFSDCRIPVADLCAKKHYGIREWFEPTDALLKYIAEVKSAGHILLEDCERHAVAIANLRRKGATYSEIGRMYGVSRQRIHQISRELRECGHEVTFSAFDDIRQDRAS